MFIRPDNSNAIRRLKAKIADAEKEQEKMRGANKIIRDHKLTDDEKVARLGGEHAIPPGIAELLLKPDFVGRVGFPDYQLTNNNANIRRWRMRVRTLETENARGSMSVEFPGGRMEDSAEDYRVKIYHDATPAPEIIEKLNAHGFLWSPSCRCWLRLRSNAARDDASLITGASWPAENAPPTPGAPVAPSVRSVPALNPAPGLRP